MGYAATVYELAPGASNLTPSPPRRPRVVIVDDDPGVLVAFKRLLQPTCEVVACVSNGDAAVDAAHGFRPDVMVADLMMPDMDGLEVCRQVKATSPDTDVVIVTAFDDLQMERIALQVGASAFVGKLSAATTLTQIIRRLVRKRRRLGGTASGNEEGVVTEDDLHAEHEQLLSEMRELEQEHIAIEGRPVDLVEHRRHTERLRALIQRLRQHIDRLKRER